MNQPLLIIVTGMPGTGKTTLSESLSNQYKLPLISKDSLKERIFDTLGWSDKAWSLKVSSASHRIMDYLVDEQLKSGQSVIVESNFKREIDSLRFNGIKSKHNCNIIQILCWAEGETVFRRFMERIENGQRHQGHTEDISTDEIRRIFVEANGRDEPLDIDGATVELDTTHPSSISYDEIHQQIDRLIAI